MTFLQEIVASQRARLASLPKSRPLDTLLAEMETMEPARDFTAALREHPSRPALVAEVKRASPSRGLLVEQFDPAHLARTYQENGAAAISVLTEPRYFQGDLSHLRIVGRQPACPPVLRKDFILDPYQIYESRAAGADAVLLIVSILTPKQLSELHALTRQLGMAALVEVHTKQELDTALEVEPKLIGVNNRNLRSFGVDLKVSRCLIPLIPGGICAIAESGIRTPSDAEEMARAGADAVLVGEALACAADIGAQVRALAKARPHED